MQKIVLQLLFLSSFLTVTCANKNPHSLKIEKAMKLMQEAMMLLKETQITLEEKDKLDPAKFHEALNNIKNGNYELAKSALVAFSKEEDEFAMQALYWLGVCFMEEKNFEKAMIAFLSFLNKASTTDLLGKTSEMKKAANKYLVRCFQKLNRPVDACAILEKMEKEFPNEIEYVKNAKEYLKCSNCEKNKESS